MKFNQIFLAIWLIAFGFISPSQAAGLCTPDVDGSGLVDNADLSEVLNTWGTGCSYCPTDVDRDGFITILDYLSVEMQLGLECAICISTELAGNSLPEYPFFEHVTAFNQGVSISIGLDSTRFPEIIGQTADIYIVEAKTLEEWEADPTLTDATGDGFQTETFVDGPISDNSRVISGSNTLSAEAGLGLGRAYDMVVDFNQNGTLDDGDFIDGLGDEPNPLHRKHGLYVVHDLTQPGPLPVTEITYTVNPGSVTAGFESENTFYPTDIASMGALPLIIISHGNGHNFAWYDHLGNHMASYGYVVMSHANNTVPGVFTASTTTLEHTDAFLNQLGQIEGGVLSGHIDRSRMVWLGHSRGGEGVAIAVDRIFKGEWTPFNYSLDDLALVSSIAPVDFLTGVQTHPHNVNYHLWTGGSDADVNGCASCNLCQTFHLHDRATDFRQSISLHGVGHGDFHNGGGSSVATGPCLVGRSDTHEIMKGHFLPLVKHYVEGNVPGKDFLWRQWESFKPIGAPTDPCVVVDLMYREAPGSAYVPIDDFQTQPDTTVSSSGGAVTHNLDALNEGLFDDANDVFTHDPTDPMNSITLGGQGDDTRGAVLEFSADSFYEQELVSGLQDLSGFKYLSFRAAQTSRHPNTTAAQGDLTFTVTLRDGTGTESSINIGAYGGGIEEPYQRENCGVGEGWAAEFETIRIRLTDFLNGSILNLTDIHAVRFELGPSFGSATGRIGLDDIGLSKDEPPPPVGGLVISVTGGLSNLIEPGSPVNMTLNISGVIESLVPDTAFLHYRLDGGVYQSVALAAQGGDVYTASLPALTCGDTPEFYFTAEGSITGTATLPRTAPVGVFNPAVGVVNVVFTENFDTDPGWSTEGSWAFGQPTGQGGANGSPDPTSGFTGTNVYGYDLNGDYTNNMPEFHLTSTPFNFTGLDNVTLSFKRWLGVETSNFDHARVQVSIDGGTNWTQVWENGATIADFDWTPVSLDLSAIASNQASVLIRWTMGTTDTSQVFCGWNIDDLQITALTCP